MGNCDEGQEDRSRLSLVLSLTLVYVSSSRTFFGGFSGGGITSLVEAAVSAFSPTFTKDMMFD